MGMTFKQRCYSVGVSLALHVGLAVALLFSYISTTKTPILGLTSGLTIHSYVALERSPAPRPAAIKPQSVAPKTAPLEVAPNTADSEDLVENDNAAVTDTVQANPQPTTAVAKPQVSKGQSQDALLILLHNAILVMQHYPASALSMKRHGTVQVGFVLQPDGTAHDIELLQSSGTSSLDQAALQAIGQASPFVGVSAYLAQDKHFSLDVVFTLPT